MANFFRIGSAGLNWSNVGSWSATSGGSSNGSAQPTSSDNVTFDSNSPATVTVAGTASANTLALNKASLVITLNGGSVTASGLTTVSQAATINKTASETFSTTGINVASAGTSGTAKIILIGGTWTGTASGTISIANDLDLQGNVTISGTVSYKTGIFTYVSGTITTTSSTIRIDGSTATLHLNGFTIASLSIFATTTLTSNLSCNGTLRLESVVNWTTAETMTSSGGLSSISSGGSGTAKVILTGGTWSSTKTISNSIDLQGNVTISSVVYGDNNALTGGKTLTYVSGTITTTGGTLTIAGAATLNTSGVTWNNFTTGTAGTSVVTLTSNLSMSGLFTTAFGTTINKTTAETLTTSGGMTITAVCTGTAKVILTGGTWTGGSTSGIANNVDLQGSVTISSNVYYTTGTLNYVSGTITVTSSTLNLVGSCTLTTNGMSWNNVTCSSTTGFTYTINSLLTVNATLTLGTGSTAIFAGTAGFTCATLSCASISSITITLQHAVTYTVTTAFNCFQSRTGAIVLFTSDDGTLLAILTLVNPSTCNCLASFTRIDSSAGRTINTFNGVVTSCNNIRVFNDLATVSV